MTEPTKGHGGRPGLPGWVFTLALGLLAAAVTFHAWVGLHAEGEKVAWWGVLGDSAGPLSAVFNAGALLAALWAVHLQRQESHDARIETQEQLHQFTRTAEAQQALSASQERLALAQERANELAPYQELATRRMALATFNAALIHADTERAKATGPAARIIEPAMAEARELLGERIREEGARIIDLERKLDLNKHPDEP